MRFMLRNLLALLALVASFVAASTTVVHADTASGGIGIELAGSTEIVGTFAPGEPVVRRVRISNTAATTKAVDVYAGAASMRGGEFEVQDRGSVNALTSWTSLSTKSISLAPGRSEDVVVTVRIPADAPTGDRHAVVWAQGATGAGGGIVTAARVGVRMNLRVGPAAGTTADFAIEGLATERDSDGQAVVVADIRNTGGWAAEVGGELTLTDGPGGRALGPLYADEVIVATGAAGKVRFRIPNSRDLASGPWQAHVALESGAVERGRDGEITFPTPESGGNGSLGSLGSSGAGSTQSPLMWVGVAGAAAAAIGAIGWTVLQQQNPPAVR